MKKLILAFALMLMVHTSFVYADSATFQVAPANQEDTSSVRGNINDFANASGWLFIGYSSFTTYSYDGYVRFASTIPIGSTITAATLEMRCDYTNGGTSNWTVLALATDNKWETTNGFNTTSYANGNALTAISTQGSGATWTPAGWTAGTWYTSSSIVSVVAARIDDGDYDPGHAENKYIGIKIRYDSGGNFRTGTQEPDTDSYLTKLHVEWTPPAAGGNPQILINRR